ncbi:MAG: ABC transporter substrate-binding protein [Chloroflexota bacterium]
MACTNACIPYNANWNRCSCIPTSGVTKSTRQPYFHNGCQTPAYRAFRKQYETTHGQLPSFAASIAYESIYFLGQALSETGGQPEGLLEALAGIKKFRGLCDDILMDVNGDVLRTIYLMVVKDGRFSLLNETPPNP